MRPFVIPCTYSRNEVNRAGDLLISASFTETDEHAWALKVLNSWRVSHTYPINTFQANLRMKIRRSGFKGFVAERLKRVPSIVSKLKRQKGMRLSRMQDIGGLRAVVESVTEVYELRNSLMRNRLGHELIKENDYIATPKESGYRSIHLIYKYKSDKVPECNGHQLEIQLRTKLQHSWATAVETMGTFLNKALKSSEGPEKWLQFFIMASAAFADIEDQPRPAKLAHLSRKKLWASVSASAKDLDVCRKLRAYGTTLKATEDIGKKADYFLIVLNTATGDVRVKGYQKRALESATDDYLNEEKATENNQTIQVVLVKLESVAALRKAYPNYFLDTQDFIETITKIIDGEII